MTLNDSANVQGVAPESAEKFYKRDFWIQENQKHVPPHYRLQKCARIVNNIAGGNECDLLDVGCGPATLMHFLDKNIHYHGIDIAIHDPAPNLIESDFVENPIGFAGNRFNIIVAQGVFEYVGEFQDQKFGEIAGLLKDHGTFILTYTNFGHQNKRIYEPFNNVKSFVEFRQGLERHFVIERYFPTSHNWSGGQPVRKLMKTLNMRANVNVPVLSPRLAVEYFFICSRR